MMKHDNMNVLLIVADQFRSDLASFNGGKWVKTPNLDLIAEHSLVFDNAYCTTPLCVPSRSVMFTGKYARRLGIFYNDIFLDEASVQLPEILRGNGYELAMVGKNHAFTSNYLKTWDFCELFGGRGKEEHSFCSEARDGEKLIANWRKNSIPFFEAPVHETQPGELADDPTVSQTDYALKYLSGKNADKPFFMYLSYEAPHFPYVLPKEYFNAFSLQDMPGSTKDDPLFKDKPERLWMQYYGLNMDEMDEDDIKRVQASYLGMIKMLDDQLGRVIDSLKKSGEWENTILIFTSDHGDFWGKHGLIGKTNAVYEDLLRIPLMIRAPGMTQGKHSAALLDNSDIFPTILELLGMEIPESIQGRSLAHCLHNPKDLHRKRIVAESSLDKSALNIDELFAAIDKRKELFDEEGAMWFVNRLGGMTRSLMREDGMKVIHNEIFEPELYNLKEDSDEMKNLAALPEYKEILMEMLQELQECNLA